MDTMQYIQKIRVEVAAAAIQAIAEIEAGRPPESKAGMARVLMDFDRMYDRMMQKVTEQ